MSHIAKVILFQNEKLLKKTNWIRIIFVLFKWYENARQFSNGLTD